MDFIDQFIGDLFGGMFVFCFGIMMLVYPFAILAKWNDFDDGERAVRVWGYMGLIIAFFVTYNLWQNGSLAKILYEAGFLAIPLVVVAWFVLQISINRVAYRIDRSLDDIHDIAERDRRD